MAWNGSGWHGSWAWGILGRDAATHNLLSGDMRYAMYFGTVTPVRDPSVLCGYGIGCWNTGEVVVIPGWPVGGQPARNIRVAAAADPVTVSGDHVFSDGPATINPAGGMLYDHAADQGDPRFASMCFHDFGGAPGSNNGYFAIYWGPAGIAVVDMPVTAP